MTEELTESTLTVTGWWTDLECPKHGKFPDTNFMAINDSDGWPRKGLCVECLIDLPGVTSFEFDNTPEERAIPND